jgi:hypothetical protein
MKRKVKSYIIGWFAYTPTLSQEGEMSINLTDGYSLISSTSKRLVIDFVKQTIFKQPQIHKFSKVGIYAKELKKADLQKMIDNSNIEILLDDVIKPKKAVKRKKKEVWADTIED